MSVLIKLRDGRKLSETEFQIRTFILKHTKEVLNMTVYELAKATYTSPATVIRFCKKLNVGGFRTMKIALASEVKTFENLHLDALDTTSISAGDSEGEIIDKITNITLQSIEESRILVDESVMLEAAKKIMGAATIDFYGAGASHIVAMDATYKFMRIGRNVACFGLIDRQLVQATNADPTHVALIISYSGETKEMLDIAKRLQSNGVTIITLTSSQSNTLTEYGDINLFVSAKETIYRSGAMASRSSQLYIMDILYALCIHLDYDHCTKQINKTLIISK